MYDFEGNMELAFQPRVMYRGKPPFIFGREPTLRRMPDGSLISFIYTGGPIEPHPQNVVCMINSYDDGETWSDPKVLFKHPIRSTWGTEIFTESEQPFAVFHTFNSSNYYCELRSFISHTPDSGRTWSAPVNFPGVPSNFCCRQGRVLSDGSWLFPVYWSEQRGGWDSYEEYIRCPNDARLISTPDETVRTFRYPEDGKEVVDWQVRHNPDGFKKWVFVCGVIRSTDHGKSYSIHGNISPAEGYTAWEPDVIELEPGHLRMYIRCDDSPLAVLFQSDSFDYGCTWSPAVATDIPNPGTKFTMLRIRGKVVLVNNVCTPDARNRNRLELWVSNDNCQSWSRKILLANRPHPESNELSFICYPHGFADEKSETLYLGIDAMRIHFLLKIPFNQFLD